MLSKRWADRADLNRFGLRSRRRTVFYLRFTLSYRDVEELLAERGLDIMASDIFEAKPF
jgi:hypothetical protein